MYYTYMLRCEDNSIYTGITKDVFRRFSQHLGKKDGGAKYTKSRVPVSIEKIWKSETRSYASKLEYRIKKLSKNEKEKLIENPDILHDLLGDKLDLEAYTLLEAEDMIKEKILELREEKWEFLGEINPDMTLGVYGLFMADEANGIRYAINGTFEELDEAGVCISSKIDCALGDETHTFDGNKDLIDFVYKQLHSNDNFDSFRHEYEKLQYEGVTSYLLEYIKNHEFLLLEKDEVEAEDGIALEFQGMLDSGLFISGLIYEIEDEYRNSYIDFAYDDYLYISLEDSNYFVEDPYLKDYIVSMLENIDFTC